MNMMIKPNELASSYLLCGQFCDEKVAIYSSTLNIIMP